MADVKDLEPYSGNVAGLTSVLTDIVSTMPNPIVFKVVGYKVNVFENVTQGDVLYSRSSDGQVGKAIANDTADKALVAGFAQTTKSTGQSVNVIVRGLLATSGLDEGDEVSKWNYIDVDKIRN